MPSGMPFGMPSECLRGVLQGPALQPSKPPRSLRLQRNPNTTIP
eukprot:CAMPEP_0170626374 /NCGR_PEP_ID=MMETSP0224-20130122/31323_1 /TAXON_ID=285029 /ORGANISM="Togula jolla, Strain CCCM 725" /LENGTH=43 /DNA_ID= /DNA_START= /DNA_END= /DNA_ORIENTATION=